MLVCYCYFVLSLSNIFLLLFWMFLIGKWKNKIYKNKNKRKMGDCALALIMELWIIPTIIDQMHGAQYFMKLDLVRICAGDE